MELAFAGRLLAACAVIAAVLFIVQHVARLVLVSSPLARRRNALLAIVETASLPGAASLHVVRVAERYYVIGRSGAHIAALCEIPAQEVALGRTDSAASTGRPLGPWRKRMARPSKAPAERHSCGSS